MIRNVHAADLPACLEVIRKSFATVAEEFGLTPENCPTHNLLCAPLPAGGRISAGG